MVAAYLIGRSVGGGRTTATLILAGVTVAAFLTAAQVFVQQQNSDTLNEVYAWLLGGLTTAGWGDVLTVLPYVALSAAVLLLHRRTLDVLAVGDEEARSLGLDVTRLRLLLVAAATLGTAAAVAVSGLIGFVGIVVPHLVRLVVSLELPRDPAAVRRSSGRRSSCSRTSSRARSSRPPSCRSAS